MPGQAPSGQRDSRRVEMEQGSSAYSGEENSTISCKTQCALHKMHGIKYIYKLYIEYTYKTMLKLI